LPVSVRVTEKAISGTHITIATLTSRIRISVRSKGHPSEPLAVTTAAFTA
jgi:hypothetical protein